MVGVYQFIFTHSNKYTYNYDSDKLFSNRILKQFHSQPYYY